MKELEQRKLDKQQVSEVRPIQKGNHLLGSIIPKKGHTLFELNLKNSTVAISSFESIDADLKGNVRKKTVVKPDCIYISALNEKNAIKVLKRRLFIN